MENSKEGGGRRLEVKGMETLNSRVLALTKCKYTRAC